MDNPARPFYAKVLLFGEYSLLLGSAALTIPYRGFAGTLQPGRPPEGLREARASNRQLRAFYGFLSGGQPPAGLPENETAPPGNPARAKLRGGIRQDRMDFHGFLDLARFSADLKEGLWFRSSIPSGYGMGSSGALVAAVYDRYRAGSRAPAGKADLASEEEEQRLPVLKDSLGRMESYFHGSSSGIDPLSCYLGAPLLMEATDRLRTATLPENIPGENARFFLIDTGSAGNTGPLVRSFLDKAQQPSFSALLQERVIPATNACIQALMDGETGRLGQFIRELSFLQLQHFREMIPGPMTGVWEKGLADGTFALKLCGSGGGGFLLGYDTGQGETASHLPRGSIPLPLC